MGSLEILAERHRRAREAGERPEGIRTAGASLGRSTTLLRRRSRIPALDLMTGGGFVNGTATMIHGAPGCGKSTLMAQAAIMLPGSVYVSAEESFDAVSSRFIRLGGAGQMIINESDMPTVLDLLGQERRSLVVVDSISRMRPKRITTAELVVDYARATGTPIVLICQETKEGGHAGPRELEHLIDCTLELSRARVLSVEKNRHGPAPASYQLGELTGKGFQT